MEDKLSVSQRIIGFAVGIGTFYIINNLLKANVPKKGLVQQTFVIFGRYGISAAVMAKAATNSDRVIGETIKFMKEF